MNITQKYLTNNLCYITAERIKPTHIIVHSIGVAQPDPEKVFNSFNVKTMKAAVHAIVHEDGAIQTLPWTMRSWGCGGQGNNIAIQFEMCEPAGHTYPSGSSTMAGYDVNKNEKFFNKVYNNAVDLAVHLCNLYNIPASSIMDHSEAYKKGLASNHGDVMHWFPKHGKSMDTFRADVKAKIDVDAVPTRSITKVSSSTDIAWLQRKLNKVVPTIKGIVPLVEDGIYGNKTRIALLLYWETLKWNKDGSGTGWTAGKKTIDALTKI